MSHNIRGGIGTKEKWQDLIEFMEEESSDILMVQEPKIKKGDATKLQTPPNYEMYASEGKSRIRQRGVMTFIKKTLATRAIETEIYKDEEGRILVIPIQTLVTGQRLWIGNIYAPASQQENSINSIQAQIDEMKVDTAELNETTEQRQTDQKEKENSIIVLWQK